MELLGLIALLLFLYLLIAPLLAWLIARGAAERVERQEQLTRQQGLQVERLKRELGELREELRRAQWQDASDRADATAKPAATSAAVFTAAEPTPPAAEAAPPAMDSAAPAASTRPPAWAERSPPAPAQSATAVEPVESGTQERQDLPAPALDLPEPLPTPTAPPAQDAAADLADLADLDAAPAAQTPANTVQATTVPAPESAAAHEPPPAQAPVESPAAARQAAMPAPPPAQRAQGSAKASPAARPTAARPAPPRRPPPTPGLLERGWQMARDWLFGGNLVARVGLLILFIGVAFLLRYASAYVVVPIEVRLAGIAAGAIALLLWGWRIRRSRPGIALSVQGAALATLMLVVFGAYKLYGLLPASATFALLLLLVAFTCLLAVLQDALWLAIFGIVGGFAVPILTSTGEGSHVALFSYYALLNGGILAIAWHRSWRALNVLGFLFTFVIGSYWGVQRYSPEHYASSQGFLALFLLFYVAIAVLYAWRQAPRLRSYVDATLVFGVPTVAMGLQYGLVKHLEFGPALSALAFGLFYALVASALWRWRRGSPARTFHAPASADQKEPHEKRGLQRLVESFLALAVVFGTLAIPLAFDGRWTAAAWALQGAGMVWVGLRQRQPLVWRFGILLQFGSWLAFLKVLTGVDPLYALREHLSLGLLLLGATAVFLALQLRQAIARQQASEEAGLPSLPWLPAAFISIAAAWLLAGLWLEVALRVDAQYRASLYVATAIALILALQWLGRRSDWRVPLLLGAVVGVIAGVSFLSLMARYMRWYDLANYAELSLAEMLASGALLGGLMLTAAALVSAWGFRGRALTALSSGAGDGGRDQLAATGWLLLALFWFCGFALHGAAHLLAWASSGDAGGAEPWYRVSFWAAYGVMLGLSGWGAAALARRLDFPGQVLVGCLVWPLLLAIGTLQFLLAVAGQLPLAQDGLFDFNARPAPAPDLGGALLGLLGSPLTGALLLVLCCSAGWRYTRRLPAESLDQGLRQPLAGLWLLALAVNLYLPLADSLALHAGLLLHSLGGHDGSGTAWLATADWRLGWYGLIGALAIRLGLGQGRWQGLRWLALPAFLLQAMTSLVLLGGLYLLGRLPSAGTGAGLLVLWLALALGLRWLQQQGQLVRVLQQGAHFGRVIAPWLMLAPVLALNLERWMQADGAGGAVEGWVQPGLWPDYLAAWVAIGLLLLGLRQVRRNGWPVAPLADWYGALLIPLAAVWALLLVLYWNLRQDGSMAPLPYLPLLNPLDLTTGFVALLLADLWRMHGAGMTAAARRLYLRSYALLAFLWFNLVLLRSAAQYLGLPYRFGPLYDSQLIQAMLSIVWTLCAFALMRWAVGRLSRPLWMAGALLLAVVVLKLFLVDLKNVGGIERVVSFMGVGGLMLLIGYLAPLPRGADDTGKVDDGTERNA